MKKPLLAILVFLSCVTFSQGGYEIKITIKNFPDTVAYLAKHTFGKQYIVDTCKKVVNGNMVFKGKRELEKGMYFIASLDKSNTAIHRFDLIVNDASRMTITSDMSDIQYHLKVSGSKENQAFFDYTRFFIEKNKAFGELTKQTKGKS